MKVEAIYSPILHVFLYRLAGRLLSHVALQF